MQSGLNGGFIGLMNGTTILESYLLAAISAIINGGLGMQAWDKPNSTSPQTYNLKVRGDGTVSAGVGGNADTGGYSATITVTEIQG